MWYACLAAAASRSGRDGASNGQGPIAFTVSRGLSRRSVLRGLLGTATLAQWFRLPRLRRASRGGFEESGLHLRVRELRPSDINHGGYGDAPHQAVADDGVLGRASHGDAFQRHVGAATGGSTRRHLQDRLAPDAEAAAIDGRSRT